MRNKHLIKLFVKSGKTRRQAVSVIRKHRDFKLKNRLIAMNLENMNILSEYFRHQELPTFN